MNPRNLRNIESFQKELNAHYQFHERSIPRAEIEYKIVMLEIIKSCVISSGPGEWGDTQPFGITFAICFHRLKGSLRISNEQRRRIVNVE